MSRWPVAMHVVFLPFMFAIGCSGSVAPGLGGDQARMATVGGAGDPGVIGDGDTGVVCAGGDTSHCTPCGSTCTGEGSTLVAISHSLSADQEVLYRIKVPRWQPMLGPNEPVQWGDGHNGFFYEVTVNDGEPQRFFPFNGFRMGLQSGIELAPFSFILEVDVSNVDLTSAKIVVKACSTNRTATQCSDQDATQYWTDLYGPPLSAPEVFVTTTSGYAVTPVSAEMDHGYAVPKPTPQVANNGIYGEVIQYTPTNLGTAQNQDQQIQWLYDHLVWVTPTGGYTTT